MHLLVIGANGLLGSNVVSVGRQRGWNVSGTYHSTAPDFDVPRTQFDIGEHDTFDGVRDEYDPDVIVNCAAMTDVDAREERPARAHLPNGEAPGSLAAQCGRTEPTSSTCRRTTSSTVRAESGTTGRPTPIPYKSTVDQSSKGNERYGTNPRERARHADAFGYRSGFPRLGLSGRLTNINISKPD